METGSVKAVRNHRNKERREKAVIKAAEREVHMREVQIQIEPFGASIIKIELMLDYEIDWESYFKEEE